MDGKEKARKMWIAVGKILLEVWGLAYAEGYKTYTWRYEITVIRARP